MNTTLKLALPALLFLAFFQNLTPRGETPRKETDSFCSQAELHARKMQTDESYRLASQRLEDQLYALAQQPAQRGPLVQHTLSVVVHIIHNGGNENISDAQVTDALQHLNDAFANVGYYNPATGVDTEIAFCLARRSPDGNATTGVNRVQSALTDLNNSTDDQAMKNLSRWSPTQYINVWVVKEICSNNGCGVAGYAYLPGAHGQPYDGIVLEANYMGSNPTASTVLIHEMGHYLGLYHTFEGGCPNGDCQQQGDRVCDTPPDNTTARTPCSADMNSCDTDEDDTSVNNPFRPVAQGGLGGQVDQKENYMDYSRFECYDRFSQGQKDRMLSVVETIRSSLLDSPACIDPCPAPVEASFSASALSVPLGSTVDFTNISTNANSYEWAIDGTLFSSATNASYTFNTEGSFQVTLTAFSSLNNCLPQDSTITIEVFCPVEASFTASGTSVLAGASVTFTNTSANATAYTWLVNGTAVSNGPDFTLNTTEPGLYNICLVAENALCEDIQCTYVEATTPSGGGCENSYFFTIGQVGANMRGSVLAPAASGGYYLGGDLNGQSIIMKLNEGGSMEWQYLLPFSDEENILDLEEDEEGFLIGSGIRTGAATDGFCFKFDPQGQTIVWANYFAPLPRSRFYKILSQEALPYYIILGESYDNPSTSGNGCDATFTMIDKINGQVLNQRHFNLGTCEYFHNAIMTDDAIYATGRYNNAFNGEYAIRPALAKLSLTGEMEWSRLYLRETPGLTARLYGRDIVRDGNEMVVAGYGDLNGTSASNVVCTLFKTDLDGNILWGRQMDVPGAINERLHMIFNLADGYLLIGKYNKSVPPGDSDVIFIKTDKEGIPQWTKIFDNLDDEVIFDQSAFMRNGFLHLTGTLTNNSGIRAFILKFDPQDEVNQECLALRPANVEFSSLPTPYDGFHDVVAYDYIRPHSTPSISPESTQLQTGNFCGTPCAEICNNGLDDDGDGLADCEDDDCPCFVDCGNTFVKTIGGPATADGATAIVASDDGNFYIGGYLNEEGMIAKVTPDGEFLWVRTFDFTDRPDHIISLSLDSDGFLVGASFGDAGIGPFGRGATVFRYDPDNDQLIWVNYFNDMGTPDQVITNPANGNFLFVGGDILTTGGGNADNASLAELDRNTGNVLWRKEFNLGTSDRFFSLLPVGNVVYCLGRYTFYSNFEKMRVTLAAFTGAGNLEWSKYYLAPSTLNARMYAPSLQLDASELVASFYGDPNGTDLAGSSISGIMKTNLAGGLLWAKWYQLAGYPSLQSAFELVVVPDGYLLYGYAIAGDRDLVIIKTDKQGNALWAKAYGGPADEDLYYSFCTPPILQSGGNIYFVGRSRDGSDDALFVKALADGSLSSSDCDFFREVPVTTNNWTNLYEADANLQEQPNPNINPQLQTVQAVAANPDCNILCEASPIDAIVTLDSAYCNGDSLAVALHICNEGTDTLSAGLPFTFYDGNPTASPAATMLSGGQGVPVEILPGGCFSAVVAVPYPQNQLYCIANDNGSLTPVFNLETDFPPTEIIECDYTNNLDSIGYEQPVPVIDLGPDTSVCENGVFLLDAGPGFASYRWQDGAIGPTYTTFETGTFWVEATTACGDVASDTIRILLDTAILITLPPDTSICPGASVNFSTALDPAYTYQWSPAATLNCTGCPAPTATPETTTTYTLVVSNTTGCVSVDSVMIIVENCGNTLDTAICRGDSLLIEGQVLYPNEIDTLQLMDGSSLIVTVTELEDNQTYETIAVCQGEVGYVFGEPVTEQGLYTETYPSYLGCDSTHNIAFVVLDTAVLYIEPGGLGCGSRSGRLTVEISGATPPYEIEWSNGHTTATAIGLPVGAYSVTVTDAFGCQSVAGQQVYDIIPILRADPGSTPASCFGEKDGAVQIDNPSGGTPPYEYSLDGDQWQTENRFTGLAAGVYTVFIRDKEECENMFSVTVSEPAPLGIRLPGDTTLRLGDSLRITPFVLSGMPSIYEWIPPFGLDCADCPAPVARPEESTNYQLTIRDSTGCAAEDEITVYVDKSVRFYLPTAFSPNEDGRNDFFTVFAAPEVERVQTLQVFSRWGELVFQRDNFAPNQERMGWDGTFRGQQMAGGVYAYFVEVVLIDGRVETMKGEAVLVR